MLEIKKEYTVRENWFSKAWKSGYLKDVTLEVCGGEWIRRFRSGGFRWLSENGGWGCESNMRSQNIQVFLLIFLNS
jgi:hypothetical protein